MPVTTTTDLNLVRQQILQAEYDLVVENLYIHSQGPFVWSPPAAVLGPGHRVSSGAIPFFFNLPPSTAAISQTADITPTTMSDQTFSISPAMYARTINQSEFSILTY